MGKRNTTGSTKAVWATYCQTGSDFEAACREAVRLAAIANMITDSLKGR